jgi:hypothetical protein
MKKLVLVLAVVVSLTAIMFGCAGKKPPVMQDGKQVAIFILSDRGITAGMKEDERNDRNEMGQGMEEEMVRWLSQQGYNTTLIQNRTQYVQGSSNYLVTVKIKELKLVGRSARAWMGMTAGPTILKNHYEVSGSSNKLALSYDDEESTVRDWMAAPQEMTVRLWRKIDEKLIGNSK